MTIVAVVGAGLRDTPGVAARVFGVLAERNINVISIAQGSSEFNLSLVVRDEDADESLRAIHDAFQLDQEDPAALKRNGHEFPASPTGSGGAVDAEHRPLPQVSSSPSPALGGRAGAGANP